MKTSKSLKGAATAIVFWCVCATAFSQGITDEDFCNKFAFKMHHALEEMVDGNIAFSPVSAELALASFHNGPTGETLEEVKHALGTEDYTAEEVNQYNKALVNALRKNVEMTDQDWGWTYYIQFGAPQVIIANTYYENVKYYQATYYKRPLEEYYKFAGRHVEFKKTDIDDYMGRWIDIQTNRMVPYEHFEADSDAPLYLSCALALQAQWTCDFAQYYPEEGEFTNADGSSSSAEYMKLSGKQIAISESDDFNMVKLYFTPIVSRRFTMNLYLPKHDGARLDFEEYARLRDKERLEYVEIFVPQFSISNQWMLKEAYKKIGVHGIFENNNPDLVDLSPTPYPDVYLSDVVHPCKVEINRYGSMINKLIPNWGDFLKSSWVNFTLRFDHPFYYTIEDNENHVILLMGRLNHLGDNDGSDGGIDDPSSIETATLSANPSMTYDLSGRASRSNTSAASKTGAHGVYIENGRKVFR